MGTIERIQPAALDDRAILQRNVQRVRQFLHVPLPDRAARERDVLPGSFGQVSVGKIAVRKRAVRRDRALPLGLRKITVSEPRPADSTLLELKVGSINIERTIACFGPLR